MGTQVHKKDLIREVAEATGATAKQVQSTIEQLLASIAFHAAQGATVRLTGFGSFAVKARPARTGRNPATGQQIEIPETTRLTFKASKTP